MPPPGLAALLAAALSSSAAVGAAGHATTLPGVALTEAEWAKLNASEKVEDFAAVLKPSAISLFAVANATLAAAQASGLSVKNTTFNFHLTKPCREETEEGHQCKDECQALMRAWRSNSTATLARGAEPLVLGPGMPGIMGGDVYEVNATAEVPFNTSTTAFAILREQYPQLMNSYCAPYSEKPLNFTVHYATAVPTVLTLSLSSPRTEESENGARQVVFNFSASMYRNESRNLSASLEPKIFLDPDGPYGCRIKYMGRDVEKLWNWLPWFRNFTFCNYFKQYFEPRLDSVVSGGVARIVGVALRNVSGRIIEAVGTSVIVPIRIEGAVGNPRSASSTSGSGWPIAI